MVQVVPVETAKELEDVVALSQEYVTWMVAEIRRRYPELDVGEFTSEHEYDDVRKKFPGEHVPPDGCLLIASSDAEACGCVALGRLTETVCEMRTLFVRPSCRGKGIGRKLAEASLDEARKLGYAYVRLDTLSFMDGALGLYRSLGFYEISPYRDMPASLKRRIRFLELKLP
ncbi:MAG: GNAT family N-acetyltransferase [Nitrososphaerales archaeon]|jgi:ribosomal protein S18 acetylase RimI-like enzyme